MKITKTEKPVATEKSEIVNVRIQRKSWRRIKLAAVRKSMRPMEVMDELSKTL